MSLNDNFLTVLRVLWVCGRLLDPMRTIRAALLGVYPPLRGTALELEGDEFILYTKGSVPFFQTYPGMYVPRPLDVRVVNRRVFIGFDPILRFSMKPPSSRNRPVLGDAHPQ